jgi:hypothetical protein
VSAPEWLERASSPGLTGGIPSQLRSEGIRPMLTASLLALCLVAQAPMAPDAGAVQFHLGDATSPTDHFNLDADGFDLVEPIQVSVTDEGRSGSTSVDVILSFEDRSVRVALPRQGGAGGFRGDVTEDVRALVPRVGETLSADYMSSGVGADSASVSIATLCRVELVGLDLQPVTHLEIGSQRVRIRLVDLDEPQSNKAVYGRIRVIQPLDANGDGRISGPAEENWISDSEPLRLAPVDDPNGRYFLSQPIHVNNKGVGIFERGDLSQQSSVFLSILEDPSVRWNLKCSLVGSLIEMLNAFAISENGGDPEGLDLPSHVCSDERVAEFLSRENLDAVRAFFEARKASGRTLADLPIRNNRINIAPPVFRIVVEHEDADGPARDRCTYEF